MDCFFYKNLWVFSPSSGCEEKILALWRKSFKKCVKMQFMWTKKFCGKFDFRRKNFCNFFEYWSKIFRTFVKKCCVREKFWVGLFFFGKKLLSSNGIWGRRYLVFGKNFWQVRQNCTLCVRMNFLIELFFLGFFEFLHCFLTVGRTFCKNFREVVKSAFYLNNKTFRGKFVFWRKYSLSQIFGVLMKNSANFCRKTFRPIWKTALYNLPGDLLA